MGSSVIGEGFSTMQHCGQENTVTTTAKDNKCPDEPGRKQALVGINDNVIHTETTSYKDIQQRVDYLIGVASLTILFQN